MNFIPIPIPLKDNFSIREFPALTVLLIAINVVLFAAWEGGSNVDVEKVVLYGTIPYEVTHPGKQCVPVRSGEFACESEREMEARYEIDFPETWKTPFVSMFMHGSWMHLIGNMLFLFVFGLALEAGLGRRSFALFYLVGGLAADLGHTLFDPSSPLPSLGASGAVSAVMGGYLMLFPRAKIFTWVIFPLPFVWGWIRAQWVIGYLMLYQAIEAYIVINSSYNVGGGVAYFAHFGGFAAGILLLLAVLDRESIEKLRRQARIASGDERVILESTDTTPVEQTAAAAQAQQLAARQAAQAQAYAQAAQGQTAYAQHPAQQQVYAQQAYGGQAAAAVAGAQPAFAPTQYPAADPFAPPPSPQQAVPPDPFAPQPAQPPPQRQPQPPAPGAQNPPQPRPNPGPVQRPPGC